MGNDRVCAASSADDSLVCVLAWRVVPVSTWRQTHKSTRGGVKPTRVGPPDSHSSRRSQRKLANKFQTLSPLSYVWQACASCCEHVAVQAQRWARYWRHLVLVAEPPPRTLSWEEEQELDAALRRLDCLQQDQERQQHELRPVFRDDY